MRISHERLTPPSWRERLWDRIQTRYLNNPVVDAPPPYGDEYIVVPDSVKVETTNLCNSRCIMCANPLYPQNQLGFMPLERVEAIIRQAATWKPKPIFQPSLMGEPLVYPKIVEAVKLAHELGLPTRLYTNAMLLDERMFHRLVDAGLDSITTCIDGYRKETYEKVRVGLNFETVVYNLLNVWEHVRTRKKPRLNIGYVELPENREEWRQIRNFWSQRCHNFFSNAEGASNPNRAAPYIPRKIHNHCRLWVAWKQLSIRTNGDIPFCACYWYWGCEPKMGNAFDILDRHESLLRLFNNKAWNTLRRNVQRGVNLPAFCRKACFGDEKSA